MTQKIMRALPYCNNLFFFTDLDQTIIYTHNQDHKCIEYIKGKEISYMTKAAYQCYCELIQKPDFFFIPCTMRSFEQVNRITLFKKHVPKYLITDGGGNLYIDGKASYAYKSNVIDPMWDFFDFSNKMEQLEQVIRLMKQPVFKLRVHITDPLIENSLILCLVLTFESGREARESILDIRQLASKYEFTALLENRRIYIKPNIFDKSIGLGYMLASNMIDSYNDYFVTSGDSILDLGFVKLGRMSIVPGHSTIPSTIKVHKRGIYAGEEILNYIRALYFRFYGAK